MPIITSVSREILRSVPNLQREAAYALGATRWEVTRIAVLSYAKKGIFGAIILGLGRALGETMISPNIITVRRIRKTSQLLRRRSIRDISRHYFGIEYVRFQTVESVLFAILAAVAIWPIVTVVEAVRAYLL